MYNKAEPLSAASLVELGNDVVVPDLLAECAWCVCQWLSRHSDSDLDCNDLDGKHAARGFIGNGLANL